MRRSRVESAVLRVYAVLTILFLFHSPAYAADYTVKRDGTGDFTTIQACADVARAGDTCVIHPGVYSEHVQTKAGGTGDSTRITFKAQGVATMQGFDIRHPFITIQGFTISGYTLAYQGMVTVFAGGDHLRLLNNVIKDNPTPHVYGIYIYPSGMVASYGVFQGNTITNLAGNMLTTGGRGHLFEGNTFSVNNNRDYIRLFGSDLTFRRNVFRDSTTGPPDHPDFVQTFGSDDPTENILFEENWIANLSVPGSQFGQLNTHYFGVFVNPGEPVMGVVRNWTFRRNVFVNVANNGNMGIPGLTFEHNTFYKFAFTQNGLAFGGSPSRGNVERTTLTHNVFFAGSNQAATRGFYSAPRQMLPQEALAILIYGCQCQTTPSTAAIYQNLIANGYINPNGYILPPAKTLTGISQFVFTPTLGATEKSQVYNLLTQTAAEDTRTQTTFTADYNFVASDTYAAKSTSGCPVYSISAQTFCEPHGINGGNPLFASLTDMDGPDDTPFTLDDGLKPLPTSPLCGRGVGATDIGAYSCDPLKVFADDRVPPQPPTNLRIVH